MRRFTSLGDSEDGGLATGVSSFLPLFIFSLPFRSLLGTMQVSLILNSTVFLWCISLAHPPRALLGAALKGLVHKQMQYVKILVNEMFFPLSIKEKQQMGFAEYTKDLQ